MSVDSTKPVTVRVSGDPNGCIIGGARGARRPVPEEAPADLVANPWPTVDDARHQASVIAQHAQIFYGDLLHSVWLYGSRARGDNRPDSDLDVLLVRRPRRNLDPVTALGDRIERPFRDYLEEHLDGYSILFTPIQIRAASPERFETWDTMFFRSVREDGIRVL